MPTTRLLLLLGLLCLSPLATAAATATPVTLQLKWYHQFQFAGYYAALEKGYYRDAGLDVTIREGSPGNDPIDAVLSGEADFGIGASELLLAYAEGKPVVAVASIFQHSPLILLAKQNAAIRSFHDLVGKSIEIVPHEHELFAFFQAVGYGPGDFTLRPRQGELDDLIAGRVAAVSSYSTDEPYLLERKGIPFIEITPRSAGIDFYGDTLFTHRERLERAPQTVQAFRQASIKGWAYAMANPEEIADLIVHRYKPNKTREHLLYEARSMRPLILPDVVEIGYMNPGRWRHIADTYARLSLLTEGMELQGFLYKPEYKRDLFWFYWSTAAALLLVLLVAGIAIYILRLNSRLRKNEERYRLLAENVFDVIWTTDLSGHFTYVSPSVERLRGYTVEEVLQQDLHSSLTPATAHEAEEGLIHLLETGEVLKHEWEVEQYRKDGSTVWTEVIVNVVRDGSGKPVEIVGITRDATARKQLEENLQQMAHFDMLTGLPNRTLFFDRLESALHLAKRSGGTVALLFLDLDGFKGANDTYGHDFGDKILQEVTARLLRTVRESDTVARMGGDEFTLILNNIDSPEDAAQVAEKVSEAITIPYLLEGREWALSTSIGISLYPRDSDTCETLLTMADKAMYAVKHSGKNNYQFHTPPSP